MKPITVRGNALNRNGLPLICAPLVAATQAALLAEVETILAKQPDVIEWRVDFFEGVGDSVKVVQAARAIRAAAGNTPIIFTRRAAHEGGAKISVAEEDIVVMYEEVCASGAVDIIDCELSQPAENRARLRAVSRAHGVAMILSYHNFGMTPDGGELLGKMSDAAAQGADIAKIAVMPKSPADVLVLLGATEAASQSLPIPLITMSMGGAGAMTRLCGWIFGSALTFAVGKSSSAPGQIPIEEMRAALLTVHRATAG